VSSGGLTFTWPNYSPAVSKKRGAERADGALNAPAGAATLGFLGASVNGGNSAQAPLPTRMVQRKSFTLA